MSQDGLTKVLLAINASISVVHNASNITAQGLDITHAMNAAGAFTVGALDQNGQPINDNSPQYKITNNK